MLFFFIATLVALANSLIALLISRLQVRDLRETNDRLKNEWAQSEAYRIQQLNTHLDEIESLEAEVRTLNGELKDAHRCLEAVLEPSKAIDGLRKKSRDYLRLITDNNYPEELLA